MTAAALPRVPCDACSAELPAELLAVDAAGAVELWGARCPCQHAHPGIAVVPATELHALVLAWLGKLAVADARCRASEG